MWMRLGSLGFAFRGGFRLHGGFYFFNRVTESRTGEQRGEGFELVFRDGLSRARPCDDEFFHFTFE